MRAEDLLCPPNAHTRSIVCLESRCSSKRALGGHSALPLERPQQARKEHLKSALGEQRISRSVPLSVLTDFWFFVAHIRRELRLRVPLVEQQQIPHRDDPHDF